MFKRQVKISIPRNRHKPVLDPLPAVCLRIFHWASRRKDATMLYPTLVVSTVMPITSVNFFFKNLKTFTLLMPTGNGSPNWNVSVLTRYACLAGAISVTEATSSIDRRLEGMSVSDVPDIGQAGYLAGLFGRRISKFRQLLTLLSCPFSIHF